MIRMDGWASEPLAGSTGKEIFDAVDRSPREPMVPCGEQIEAQIPKLYPANQSQQALMAFARPPMGVFTQLLSPRAYKLARSDLRRLVREFDHPAARWLAELENDERQLRVLIQLLIEA